MSKHKKKKKEVTNRKPVSFYMDVTKSYYEDFVKTAHKFMRLVGLEPSDFDALSKRTKLFIMRVRYSPYRVYGDKECRVPRAYVRLFQSFVVEHEKTSYYGDPKYEITFLEYVTVGMTLIFFFREWRAGSYYLLPDQNPLLEKIQKTLLKYADDNESEHYAVRIHMLMQGLFMYITLPHYRYYAYKEEGIQNKEKCRIDNLITVSSVEPERKMFSLDRMKRSSYRLSYYFLSRDASDVTPVEANIPMHLLDGECPQTKNQVMNRIETSVLVPVYVQRHVWHRLAERLDTKNNMYRNVVFSMSFTDPKVITALNGQRLICARDVSGESVGYFPFIKQDGAILLMSFLPLSSPITPEGSALYKALKLELEDSIYMGLDKLSFFHKTDFDTIPTLKSALVKAGMWHLTQIQPDLDMERKANQTLYNMFVKCRDEVL